jgi:hypothetical protein
MEAPRLQGNEQHVVLVETADMQSGNKTSPLSLMRRSGDWLVLMAIWSPIQYERGT